MVKSRSCPNSPKKAEPPHGLFIAEGELVVQRARRAGYRMRSLLIDRKRIAKHAGLAPADVPVYAASADVLEAVTGFVLEDINNHTNIGAVFRSAAGLGMDAVLLSPTCADPLYRRSVRVSMGEVFALPYAVLPTWPTGLECVRRAGFTVLALTPDEDATPVGELSDAHRARPALLFGAEGPGLSDEVMKTADVRVRIPMSRGVDSLNVAAAAAVACYAVSH